jgi:AraC family transcriptional regulator of adaptative response / DNA-3-methyladenine glycosylase II
MYRSLLSMSDSRQIEPSSCGSVGTVTFDSDQMWRAIQAHDPRFDGWVFCGVTSTGIYCRPSCPARPKREHVRFFATAAAAQAAGFRACKRCRPDAAPGSPEWDRRADVVGRAMRLIADGVVDREGVRGLAARLGYDERHVHRQLVAVVGAGPLALARAQRAQTARVLLETTDVGIASVAFAAGFNSVRQFNDTIRDVFALTPRELRQRAARTRTAAEDGAIVLRLPYRAPFDAPGLFAFLGRRAVTGVEEIVNGGYRRSLRLPNGFGVVDLRPADAHVRARFVLDDLRDLGPAVHRCRALLDLDADPTTVADALATDELLGALVRARPGRRVPGHVDAHELAVRAILGQQVSIAAAAGLARRLVVALGEPLTRPFGTVTQVFPTAGAIAGAGPSNFAMPASRGRALAALTAALDRGEIVLDSGADRDESQRCLASLPGIGPWTVGYVALRGLRDPDAFLPSDAGVRHAMARLGVDTDPRAIARVAERWRPYRGYALQHLWGVLDDSAATTARDEPAA